MRGWDPTDWFVLIASVTGGLVALCITVAVILSVSANHAEQALCRRGGGTIQVIPMSAGDWNCYKPPGVERTP